MLWQKDFSRALNANRFTEVNVGKSMQSVRAEIIVNNSQVRKYFLVIPKFQRAKREYTTDNNDKLYIILYRSGNTDIRQVRKLTHTYIGKNIFH